MKTIFTEPDIVVIKQGTWFCRPVLWLNCPYIDKPGISFQVGVFRDWSSAILARDRLSDELETRKTHSPCQ